MAKIDFLTKIVRVIDGLSITESDRIVIGRLNTDRDDVLENWMVVDYFASNKVATGWDYDYEEEKEKLVSTFVADCTITCYGEDAQKNANAFSNRINSQIGKDLQKVHSDDEDDIGINIMEISAMQNPRILDALEFNNLVEISFKVMYNVEDESEADWIDPDTFSLDNIELQP